MCVRAELLSFCSTSFFVELNPIWSFNWPGIWKTSAGKLSLQSVHLLMRSLYTVVTLCSVLQPRYVAFQQSFIPWCGFPESSSKGRKGRLFCVCKTPLPLLFMPLSALQISPSVSSVYVCVTGEKDGWGGSEESGSRKSQIPAEASLACCLNSPNLLMFTFSWSRGVAPPCCSLSAVMHARMCPCVHFLLSSDGTHSYVTVCK